MKVSRTCSLWDELNQGLFPWIDDNIGELDAAHRLFMAVCEAVINPREFDYAKWKGNGRPPASPLLLRQSPFRARARRKDGSRPPEGRPRTGFRIIAENATGVKSI